MQEVITACKGNYSLASSDNCESALLKVDVVTN
jgi:serine carboxypeptidase-like clade I